MNDGQLQNLQHAPVGYLSLDFVWVYLLPLLIGIVSVNVLADDRENHRWLLISAASGSPSRLIVIRLAVRFALLYAVNIVVLLLACAWLSIGDIGGISAVAGLLLLYQLIWFALVGLVIQRQNGRRQNLVQYSALWMVLVFLVPGALYMSRLDSSELNLGIETLVDQRESMNNSWDQDQQAALDAYAQAHTEWANTSRLSGVFHWKWYYAMQQRSDDKVAETADTARHLRLRYDRTARAWSWLSPALGLQMALWRMADSDTLAYQAYRDQIGEYHRELQQFYFPFLFFDEKSMRGLDLENIPAFNYQPGQAALPVGKAVLGMTCFLFIVVILLRYFRSN